MWQGRQWHRWLVLRPLHSPVDCRHELKSPLRGCNVCHPELFPQNWAPAGRQSILNQGSASNKTLDLSLRIDTHDARSAKLLARDIRIRVSNRQLPVRLNLDRDWTN